MSAEVETPVAPPEPEAASPPEDGKPGFRRVIGLYIDREGRPTVAGDIADPIRALGSLELAKAMVLRYHEGLAAQENASRIVQAHMVPKGPIPGLKVVGR